MCPSPAPGAAQPRLRVWLPVLLLPLAIAGCKPEDEGGSTTAPATATPEVTEGPTTTPDPGTEPPTAAVTDPPTDPPTDAPTAEPTDEVTAAPTQAPTAAPTEEPTPAPTEEPPTEAPTLAPTEAPTLAPTEAPTAAPTAEPTDGPTETPPDGTPAQTPHPAASFYIYQTSPTNGALAVPTSPAGSFYFSEPYAGETTGLHFTLENMDTGARQSLPLTLSGDKTKVSTSTGMGLSSNTNYCMTLTVDHQDAVPAIWPLSERSCFTTRKPCGTSVQLGADTEVIQFGGEPEPRQPDVVNLLNNLLAVYGDDLYVAGMFDGLGPSTAFPQSNVLFAVGEYRSGNPAYIVAQGWASSTDECAIASNGALTCTTPEMVFPLPLVNDDGQVTDVLYLYLKGVSMTASAVSSGNFTDLNTYVLKGYMLYDDVVRLATDAGATNIAEAVVLDYDSDGDGATDAGTFELRTEPIPLTLSGCTP